MKCLMEIDSHFGLTWDEKVAYLMYRFSKMQQTGTPVVQFVERDCLVREMRIPAETLFVGRPHKYGHRIELVAGRVLLIEESHKAHLEAPFVMHSTPGYQTIFYSKTDIVGRTFHPLSQLAGIDWRDAKACESALFNPVDDLLIKGGIVRDRIRAIEAEAA